MNYHIPIYVSLFLLLFFSIVIISNKQQTIKRLNKTIDRYNNRYDSKNGGTCLYYPPNWDKEKDGAFFNYYLETYDGGKNWYAVDCDKILDEVVILGLVDTIYPKLMEHLDSWDKLTAYVSKNGALNPLDSNDVEIMKSVGFSVKRK